MKQIKIKNKNKEKKLGKREINNVNYCKFSIEKNKK